MGGKIDAACETVSERYAAAHEKLNEAANQGAVRSTTGRTRRVALRSRPEPTAQFMAEETQQTIKRLLEEQPILMAALGAALGAAVDAALPLSRQEKSPGRCRGKRVRAGCDALSSAAGVSARRSRTPIWAPRSAHSPTRWCKA